MTTTVSITNEGPLPISVETGGLQQAMTLRANESTKINVWRGNSIKIKEVMEGPQADESSPRKLRRWKSHKVVEAFQITRIDEIPSLHGAVPRFMLYGDNGERAQVGTDYVFKHNPRVGGYYVRYPDGYESWSPKHAFEEGYSEANDGE